MSTLVVSDLHLGARSGIDVLRHDEPARRALLEAATRADELVLLGDLLELREGRLDQALTAARPFFEALGAVRGERGVTLVPGNHDHQLLEGWRASRHVSGAPPLGAEELIDPAQASPSAAAVADWIGAGRARMAYPGIWLADGVYATHGHYLDRHVTVPAFEPLALRVVERALRGRVNGLVGADEYEAVVAPVYAALHELAQSARGAPSGPASGPSFSGRAYRVLAGDGRGRRPLRHRALGGIAFPALVAGLNAAGLGPLRADLSGAAMRRSSLRAMGEVVSRLGIRARHVVFGHTHRAGPLPGDDPGEWVTAGGARLHNSGSWVIERFLGGPAPQRSSYRAGGVVWLGAGAAPVVDHLLV